jgi:hypothetical protein
MEISKYSRHRIMRLANDWQVPREYFDPIYNYLVHGFDPGSFYSALLANDMFRAMASSHPSNSINGLKYLTGWIRSTMGHGIFWGTTEVVQKWLEMSDLERRRQLELLNLVYPEQDEIVMILKDQPSPEPFFYN